MLRPIENYEMYSTTLNAQKRQFQMSMNRLTATAADLPSIYDTASRKVNKMDGK